MLGNTFIKTSSESFSKPTSALKSCQKYSTVKQSPHHFSEKKTDLTITSFTK